MKKVFLKISQKPQEKYLYWNLFFSKVANWKPKTVFMKRLWAGVFL